MAQGVLQRVTARGLAEGDREGRRPFWDLLFLRGRARQHSELTMIEDAVQRPPLARAKRIVVKVGTRVLTHDDGRLALVRLFQVVESLATWRRAGREVILVSSGAMGLGQQALDLQDNPTDLADRQACAAIGQSRLMGLYHEGFARLGMVCAQVLLTHTDFEDRTRYLSLRNCLARLLDHSVIPVINENDTVSVAELREAGRPAFGDNDRLSALVASKLGCDALVLLTDVDGVFDRNPRHDPEARLLERVAGTDGFEADLTGAGSHVSRGGMLTKVEAGFVAARSGCHAVIASGFEAGTLDRILEGQNVGTWFVAREGMSAHKRWIAFATRVRGALHIDAGAVRALAERQASLLAAGVTQVDGTFASGDVVELRGPEGESVGRGIIRVDAEEVRAWLRGVVPEGIRNHALIRRNHMVLEEALR